MTYASSSASSSGPLLWGDKRFHTWNYEMRERFGTKVFKVMLDAGFTCPNRDGAIATGGCTFCSARGSGDFAGSRRDDLVVQFRNIRDRQHEKWPNAQYIGYFQAYTNTYAPVSELREYYETILAQPGVVGLSIATRPDCLPDDVIEYLAELNQRTYLWIEMGLQTVHERTSQLINRAHDTDMYLRAVEKLRAHGIRVCAHIIYGLPQETHEMMLETGDAVSRMDVQGIKIHLLHLMRKTPMVKQYEAGLVRFLERDEYVGLVVDTLERLPPEMIVHRVTGDAPRELLIGPMWSLRKWEVLNAIDAELVRRDTWQGKLWRPSAPLRPSGVGNADIGVANAAAGFSAAGSRREDGR
ncbi:TIGR01212 family radical SAM protein [Paenibacillus sp.]|uniref:TIGR01212 family radical SAM protein n=1 Tax=Paenibacillus sp. TaxID=58172 RepID=UPI002D2EFC4F|nr:TIGR01212 family radical SAM protein [Paenibacillus sp.]HZG83923.1 TIGR01212 family radical SAM protein [Paenibacillus sp.]